MSNAGGAIVAIRMRRERQIAATLRERAALSPTTATALGASDGFGRGALRSLLRKGAVKETAPGSYFLDEAAYETMRSDRRLKLVVILLVVAVAAIASFAATALR